MDIPDHLGRSYQRLFENISSCLELFIIAPAKYDFVIYSIIPDFAEIFIKLYIKENEGNLDGCNNFYEYADEAKNHLENNREYYENLKRAFSQKRKEIRNPYHHEATIHRFDINRGELLDGIKMLFSLINILFEGLHNKVRSPGNSFFVNEYAALYQFLNYQIKKGEGESYRAEKLDEYVDRELDDRFPSTTTRKGTFIRNTLYVVVIKDLLPLSEREFCRRVLNYSPDLPEKITEILNSDGELTVRQIQNRLRKNFKLSASQDELQECITDLRRRDSPEVIRTIGGETYDISEAPPN